jgi:uncharacterized protein YdhG (YjbR/CyaY superfamily)
MAAAKKNAPNDITAYIAEFPTDVKKRLNAMRKTILAEMPDAIQIISYAMPTFVQDKTRVHFAGYAGHTGFYPGADAIAEFQKEFADYKWAKGSVQFPHTQPLPLDLVRRMVAFCMEQ